MPRAGWPSSVWRCCGSRSSSRTDKSFDGLASTFLENFFSIAEAMETFGTDDVSLWDEEDGFYDTLVDPEGNSQPVRIRSLVGLLP